MKKTILFIFLLLSSAKTFSQSGYIQKLGSLATITLPDTPKIIEKDGVKQYILHHNLIYAASVTNIRGGLRDLFTSNSTDAFYNAFFKSMLAASKGQLLYRDKIKINGHDGLQFGFISRVSSKPIYGYYRTVTLNDTAIICGVMSSDLVKADNKNLTAYFDNFKVISADELAQNNSRIKAVNLGKIVAKVIMLLLFSAIGLGIVILIKKIAYKKHNTSTS